MRLLLMLFCLLLCACGQKGDLYLPEETNGDSGEQQTEEPKKTRENKS